MAGNLVPSHASDALQAPGAPVPALPDETGLTGFREPLDEGGVQWGRYVAALRRYRWLILLVTIVGTGATILVTRYLKPEYVASATIYIDDQDSRGGPTPIRAPEILKNSGWQELLTTFAVLDSVSMKERLFLQPSGPQDAPLFADFHLKPQFHPGQYKLSVDDAGKTWSLKTAEGLSAGSGAVGDSIGAGAGLAWRPDPKLLTAGRSVSFKVVTPRQASQDLRQNMQMQMSENGDFLRIGYTDVDPQRAARTVNSLLDQFTLLASQLKKAQLVEQTKALQEQMDTVHARLQMAEKQLESYKTRIITQPTIETAVAPGIAQTQPTVMTEYFKQRLEIEQLKRDRGAIEEVLGKAQSGALAVDQFQTIAAVHNAPDLNKALGELSSAEADLRALQYRYTDESKQVQVAKEKIGTLRSHTIPAYANALVAAMRTQESALGQQISSASRQLQAIPERAIMEQRLQRDVSTLATIYGEVQGRYQQMKLAEASAVPGVRPLDRAVVPERPASNTAPRLILIGFMASLGLGLALAILLDQLDKRFRYPDQVTRDLGLSILGAIPEIRKVLPAERDPEEAAQVVEAFRTIRMNLAHSYGAAGPVLLTVSSPGAGDGKSLISSNLALSFAEAGYRTLLIDGDIRRGELHRMFSTDRRPGLLDFLVGTLELDEVLRPTTHRNLTLIPCGTRHHHGPELLGSAAMRELMAQVKARYNVVIIDSPPLGAGIDPFVLGTATANMLLVLRSGETDRQMAEEKLKLLDRLPIRILGAVLNDINTEGVYKYYSYIYGYTADEETTPQLAAPSAEVGTLGS
jgi:capsular exopolysaccharide synthesis family protein